MSAPKRHVRGPAPISRKIERLLWWSPILIWAGLSGAGVTIVAAHIARDPALAVCGSIPWVAVPLLLIPALAISVTVSRMARRRVAPLRTLPAVVEALSAGHPLPAMRVDPGDAEMVAIEKAMGALAAQLDARRAEQDRLNRARTELVRDLIGASPMAVVMARTDNAAVVDVNPPACALFGVARDEAIGTVATSWYVDLERRGAVARRAPGGMLTECMTLKRADGTLIEAEVSTIPVRGSLLGLMHDVVLVTIVDVTEQTRQQRTIAAQASLLSTLMAAVPVPIFHRDMDGRFLDCNDAMEQFVGVPRGALLGARVDAIGLPTEASAETDVALARGDGRVVHDVEMTDASGRLRVVEVHKARYTDEDGAPAGTVGALIDVTDERNARARLKAEAHRDPLTDLLNRRGLDDAMEAVVSAHNHLGAQVSLVLFDLDHFKQVNDVWGHAVGDRVLEGTAVAMRASCRPGDIAARVGGEEFAVVLPHTDRVTAGAVAERVRLGAAGVSVAEAPELRVSLSAGVATWHPGEPWPAVWRRADRALYRAKRSGRNQTAQESGESPAESMGWIESAQHEGLHVDLLAGRDAIDQ